MTDTEFMANIMVEIAEYAVKNDMEPDDTIKAVAENMLKFMEISTFNNWGRGENE